MLLGDLRAYQRVIFELLDGLTSVPAKAPGEGALASGIFIRKLCIVISEQAGIQV